MSFSQTEIRDIAVSTIVLAMAFGYGLIQELGPYAGLSIAFVVVGIGFLAHELMHRAAAHRFGAVAEYRAYPFGLLLALVLSVASGGGFVFAAPGAVYISHHKTGRWHRSMDERISVEESGVISLAGPLTNIALAVAFLALNALVPFSIFKIAAQVNAFLALFNLLPFHPLDGGKIFLWDRKVWAFAFIAAAIGWL
ncbi:MAG: site-2 protease family protein [Candidatus Aenigmatarchaeota archaeon]|nr:MAG: site-2 protease family protein [Candidatus Aenigmarchaeota archaeon]